MRLRGLYPTTYQILSVLFSCLCFAELHPTLLAQGATESCPRPSPGSTVIEPANLRSRNGALKLELTARNEKQKDGSMRYCFVDTEGRESPTLRVNPGDLVILTLRNDLTDFGSDAATALHQHMHVDIDKSGTTCAASDSMTRESTNLHFHGLTIPPACHQDDVLHTPFNRGMPRSNNQFGFRKTSPLVCIGTTRIFTASLK